MSNFAQTCNLLSQYVKERRSFGDHITLGIAPKGGEHQTCRSPTEPVTLNLLSTMENSSAEDTTTVTATTTKAPAGAETAPMTILYGGRVFVFNDFRADKAKEVMELAAMGKSSARSGSDSTNNVKGDDVSNVVLSKLGPNLTATSRPDMPIMPRNSLHRFFEKRKER
ncbi:protein TIFY 10A-like isoform X2 [Tripterygium wilfordii]|nr:protein TIFY 10A-like isoform X2 [Tripterygium wilfordii]